ncbi:tail fiber protein [Breoghania sp.]|uniref:tail fiber protein n=1 Tax=Breoghania sp. TaxID=2065378 RepID=UPI0026363A80|nr:tail fiber protein [Breoghania sp.]MDJ0933690.1 tail fiber protein [Breoghania sp.]
MRATWRLCDGSSSSTQADAVLSGLFQVIDTANGGASGPNADLPSAFNLPDLSGAYLRGVSETHEGAIFGPDRLARISPRPDLEIKGNEGNRVGSYERWATGLPVSAQFEIPIKNFPFDASPNWPGGNATAARHQPGVDFTVKGEDAETRPKSLCVGWHIRFIVSASATPGTELPVGTILAVKTEESLDNWATCNGEELDKGEFADLFAVLGTRFGGDGDPLFRLPDLRGYFLRGAANADGGRDGDLDRGFPCTAEELRLGQNLYQGDLTAHPTNPSRIRVDGYPSGSKNNVRAFRRSSKVMRLTGDRTFQMAGGDAETRPINVSVRFVIKTLL